MSSRGRRGMQFETHGLEKFEDEGLKELIRNARSAHDALKLAHTYRGEYKYNWDEIKLTIMKEILRIKAIQ